MKPAVFGTALSFLGNAAAAQSISIDLGEKGASLGGQSMSLIALITILSIAPGILMMITCFPFMVTVLAILRQGIGLQQSPPNIVIVSLALFMTWFVMEPVFVQSYDAGVRPFVAETVDFATAAERAIEPFGIFMTGRVDPQTLATLAALRNEPPDTTTLSVLTPAFMLSEISRAFQVGFILFLPFLIIDMVTAAILMSMGMMMVPPAAVSLPFKLGFFVLANGWTMVADGLVRSYF